jgi:hypothetical protein
MFGSGRFNPEIIIDLALQHTFDLMDTEYSEFRHKIWLTASFTSKSQSNKDDKRPTVEKMNDFAPQYSRVFKEV